MKSLDPDPLQRSLTLQGAQIAVLGYDIDAREHALALRRAGNIVTIGVRPDTTCWARACADRFQAEEPAQLVARAEVVAVMVRELEDTWRLAEPHVAPGALVVFHCARALEAGACTRGGLDVVLVTTNDEHTGCRIAVHRDATGRALLRAVAYARAACTDDVTLRATSVEAEADLELASIGERVGSLLAFASTSERLPAVPSKPKPVIVEAEDDVPDNVIWLESLRGWRSRM